MGAMVDPEHYVICEHCGTPTQVSEEVHASVSPPGMSIGCWQCGEAMTIPPTRATLAYLDREKTLLGVATIAAGHVDVGKAILAETDGAQ